MKEERMEVDSPDGNDCTRPGTKENGLHLYPVSVNDYGEGLPYAPEDWPNPGDNWSWKVGKRIAASGYFLDRYLYPPSRLLVGARKKNPFASRLSVEQYIRSAFPGADVNAFFGSFSWKVPSKQLSDKIGDTGGLTPYRETAEHSGSDLQLGTAVCKAGNRKCSSLVEEGNTLSEFMSCDICCSEQGFCRYCCCILCCRPISSAYGGYSYIRCEARVSGGYICGHIAHIDCGLRAYMAGTVGGSIGLDAEYYCRRCDSRTDLISHVVKLVQTCETTDSRDDIEKILSVGICILRGSRKASAQQLLHHIELAMAKLKKGTNLEDVWRKEEITSVTTGGPLDNGDTKLRPMTQGEPLDSRTGSPRPLCSKFDHRIELLKLEDEIDQILQTLKLEDEIDQILQTLRMSQEYEYKLAEERLLAQKNHIQNLYEQLDKERHDLSRHESLTDAEALDAVLERVEQVKREVFKLKDMKEVANGFGKTSKHILKEHFGLEIED